MNNLEPKIRHLEMVQAIIARLAQNSFLIKGWSVFTGSALFGLAVKAEDFWIALLGVLSACVFWSLDSYYLHRERIYRNFYERVRANDPRIELFSLNYRNLHSGEKPNILTVAFSFTVAGLHALLVIVGLILTLALVC